MAPYKFNPVLIDLKYLAPKALDPKRTQMAPNKFNSIPKYLKHFFPKALNPPHKTQFSTNIPKTFLCKSTKSL
jgi:hypothetical protein